jgi:hypothetical protein
MEDAESHPALGSTARSLGARRGLDIPVDSLGLVRPGNGGFSVSPDDPMNLPNHRRPPEWGGTGKDPIWALATESLGNSLVYRPDPDEPTHGFIEPAEVMPFEEYQQALYDTRESWSRIAKEDDINVENAR